MASPQYNMRHLFYFVSFACVSLVVVNLIANSVPEIVYFAFVFSLAVGTYGVGIVFLAGLIALSVNSKSHPVDRSESFSKCKNLALIGFFMIAVPILNLLVAMAIPAFLS